jgi:hypothetical protein
MQVDDVRARVQASLQDPATAGVAWIDVALPLPAGAVLRPSALLAGAVAARGLGCTFTGIVSGEESAAGPGFVTLRFARDTDEAVIQTLAEVAHPGPTFGSYTFRFSADEAAVLVGVLVGVLDWRVVDLGDRRAPERALMYALEAQLCAQIPVAMRPISPWTDGPIATDTQARAEETGIARVAYTARIATRAARSWLEFLHTANAGDGLTLRSAKRAPDVEHAFVALREALLRAGVTAPADAAAETAARRSVMRHDPYLED